MSSRRIIAILCRAGDKAHEVRPGSCRRSGRRDLGAHNPRGAGGAEKGQCYLREDRGEDEAALQVAEALAGENVVVERPSTGRSNLYAKRAGVLVASKALVDRINGVDEAIT